VTFACGKAGWGRLISEIEMPSPLLPGQLSPASGFLPTFPPGVCFQRRKYPNLGYRMLETFPREAFGVISADLTVLQALLTGFSANQSCFRRPTGVQSAPIKYCEQILPVFANRRGNTPGTVDLIQNPADRPISGQFLVRKAGIWVSRRKRFY
jgi:hypothetical protein